MISDPNPPLNELKPRPPFVGNTRSFILRLKDEIAELSDMKDAGFTHTTDGQTIDWQITIRQEFLRKAAETQKGKQGRW